MESNPIVSIIIPTYGRPKALKTAIDSCINQTYTNIEIIVIDDNNVSSNARTETEELINNNYRNNKKVVYLQMPQNGGAPKARNYGISKSKGKYVTFLDDDDEYYENSVEKRVKFIEENDYDAIFSNIYFYNDITKESYLKKFIVDFSSTPRNWLRKQLLNGISGGISFMYKKQAILDVGGWEDIKASQEFILMLKIIGKGYKIGYYDFTVGIAHTMNEGNKITGSKSAIKGKLKARKMVKPYLYVLSFYEKRLVYYDFNTFIFRQYFKYKDLRFIWYGIKQLFYFDLIIKNKKKSIKNNVKIQEKAIFIASSGGHLTQLLKLEKFIKEFDYLIITEINEVTKKLNDKYNIKYFKYSSRKKFISFIFKFIFNSFKSLYYIIKFNPKFIITTGAGTAYPLCIIGKILGKKIIYIESFARIDKKSLSGKMIYPISDLFVVQWKEMLKLYPKAKYFGSIY